MDFPSRPGNNTPTAMRTLAIDLGTRRVGLAMSDEGGRFATPVDVLEVSTPDEAARRVAEIVAKESVDRLVVGLPLNMDDTFGPAAHTAIAWGRELSKRCGKPVLFVDERLSSFAAEQSLNDRKRGGEKMTRRQKKQRLDAVAAAGFLQAFLDGKLAAIDPE
jgi:putative holliday junction resolvase